MTEQPINAALETAKAAPSVGAIVIGWLSVPVETWAVRAGLAFILLQAAYLAWRWRRDVLRERERKAAGRLSTLADEQD